MANINAETIEDSIRDKLATALEALGVEVVSMPDDEAGFSRGFAFGRVTVAYHSSRYDNEEPGVSTQQQSAGAIVQDQHVDVEIVVEARTRRGPGGVHDLIRLIKRNLVGFKPAGLGRLRAVSDKFVDRDQGLWVHAITMRGAAMLVEAVEATDPAAKKVTVNIASAP